MQRPLIPTPDGYEELARIEFERASWPWRVHPLGQKHPALDFVVTLTSEVLGGWELLEEMFAVQLKHKKPEKHSARNEDGSVSLEGIQVDHIRYWLGHKLPILLVLYLVEENKLLYHWIDKEPFSLRPGQKTVTLRIGDDTMYGADGKAEILNYVRQWLGSRYSEPQICNVLVSATISLNEVVVPGQPNLFFYCSHPVLRPANFGFSQDFGGGRSALMMRSVGNEKTGVNRHVPMRRGRAEFVYQARSQRKNILFCAIPIERSTLVASPYDEIPGGRISTGIPVEFLNDGQWHTAIVEFDFASLDAFGFTVLAPRLNEGTEQVGPGEIALHSIRVR